MPPRLNGSYYQSIPEDFKTTQQTLFQQNRNVLTEADSFSSWMSKGTKMSIYQNRLCSIALVIFILSELITFGTCDCTDSPITEKMHLAQNSYCSLKYDPCENYTLIRCTKMYCTDHGSNCINIMELSSKILCRQYCCTNNQFIDNFVNGYTLAMCSQRGTTRDNSGSGSDPANAGSSDFVGGYILIAAFSLAFVLLFIGICICKRVRDQNEALNNPNTTDPNGFPSTCVDLKAYDINAEGPYFVNSNETCAICLDTNVNLRTHCNHFYHGYCLLAWIKKKPNNPCPLCMGSMYNPIKVYCQQCHAGDKLVNIEPQTLVKTIEEYDAHKCQNCLKHGDESFTLSDAQSKRPDEKQPNLNNQKANQKNQNNEQKDIEQQQPSDRRSAQSARQRRRHRKIESLRKPIIAKNQNEQGQQNSSSQNKIQHNFNKTSVLP